jgi:hypothetical protein
MNDTLTYFFFIPEKGIWKIGKSGNLVNRQKQIWSIGREGFTVAAFSERNFSEAHCHLLFSEFRLNGEWFKDCKEIRDFLDQNSSVGAPLPDPYVPSPRRATKRVSESRHGKRAEGKVQTSISLDDETRKLVQEAAQSDGRTVPNWLEMLICKRLNQV